MTRFQEPTGPHTALWPYPVAYGKENRVSADVLVVGGGIAGCHAALSAAQRGQKVVIVEKGATIRSGSGGAGVDHWGGAYTNPCSAMTPDESMELSAPYGSTFRGDFTFGHTAYITANESWEALLDMERWGMKIRDVDDEFAGAEFRDEATKLLFAYDYDTRSTIRVQGADVKPRLYRELKRQGVKVVDRVMVTMLLTEGGRQGGRVVGATGVSTRTGEFYVFRAKATVVTTGQPLRLWIFNTELAGSYTVHDDPNCAGDGAAMAWRAGAEFTLMEGSMASSGPFRYPAYGTGNAHNTWFACNIVDANGKQVPWVGGSGNILKTVSERYHPGRGKAQATLIPDLPERIMKGEFALPFFADLPSMPPHERRAIFGLMVGHEGKTRTAVYEQYVSAGFDPDKDMLQANVLPPALAGRFAPWWDAKSALASAPQWRDTMFGGGGGLIVDWDMRSSLEGLYTAGNQTAAYGGHPRAAATGRYAGRTAAAYAAQATEAQVHWPQVEAEKSRVFAPVLRESGIGWKELQAGVCRIMQDYCGEYKTEDLLTLGLKWMDSIRQGEATELFARNPHELVRGLECLVRLTVGEITLHSSLARRASSKPLDYKRLDYPDLDPPEWKKFITVRQDGDSVKVGELPLRFWLQPPYAATYQENYHAHSGR